MSRGLENVKIERFAGVVDKVASISRFETRACQEAGIDVEFVGHPLLDLAGTTKSKEEARELLELSQSSSIISILPGAREVEVKTFYPLYLNRCVRCKNQRTILKLLFLLPLLFVHRPLKR